MADGLWQAAVVVWTAAVAFTSRYVSRKAPERVMDEVFHIPQTQRYCQMDFTTWDNKITTFPGTYLLAAPYGSLVGLSGYSVEACSTVVLRSFNFFLGLGVLEAVHVVLQQTWPQACPYSVGIMAMALCSLPTHFFFQFLFYTDVAGVLFVLLSLLSSQASAHLVSALLGAGAVLCRQTNVAWVVFIAGVATLREFQVRKVKRKSEPDTPIAAKDSNSGVSPALAEILPLLSWMWKDRERVLRVAGGHAIVVLAFVAFVVANGGIVVGDRAAHQPAMHLAQLPYFCLFAAASLAPLWVSRSLLAQDLQRRPMPVMGDLVFLSTVFAAMIANGTITHPYLLADNRHYTFYIWKNILEHSALLRIALAPVYAACAYELGAQLSRVHGWILSAGFWACTAVTLLPAGLVEFRYFTVPVFLLAVHLKPPAWKWSALQLAVFAAVNTGTLFLFCERPFTWPDGSVARFMW